MLENLFKSKKVLAFNTALNPHTLTVFKSKEEAIKSCPGIEIAEGDWLFFRENGMPLEAVFSEPARINSEKNTYSNGIYTLQEKKDIEEK